MRRYNLINILNEARVQRTINDNLWKTVSSMVSIAKKSSDVECNNKPARDTDKNILLQKYVAGLIIQKQVCPSSMLTLENSPVFNMWAKKLISMGVTIDELHKLYNENCGNLPKAVVSTDPAIVNDDIYDETEDEAVELNTEEIYPDTEDDDIFDDTEEDDINMSVEDDEDDEVEPVELSTEEIYPDIEDDIEEETEATSSINDIDYTQSPEVIIEEMHALMFSKNKVYPKLHGGRYADEMIEYIPKFNIDKEDINDRRFNQLVNAGGKVFKTVLYKGGSAETLQGDVIYFGTNTSSTQSAYYFVTDENNGIYVVYKNNGMSTPVKNY